MATNQDDTIEAARPANTKAVVANSTPTLTATSGTQEGSASQLDNSQDWDMDEISGHHEREHLVSSDSADSQIGSAILRKMKARRDTEQVCTEEDEGSAAKRAKSMDQHNENERKRRKGLRDSVLRLREVLRKKTRKPAVNCVLTAAYSEIQELKQTEEEQERTLNNLKQRHFLLEHTLNRLRTETKEGPSEVRSVPVVSASGSRSSSSSHQQELEQAVLVEPAPSCPSVIPSEPSPPARSRVPPPLLDTRMLFPPRMPILSPTVPPSSLPLSPAALALLRAGPPMPFPFSTPFPAMGPRYFFSRIPHHHPSFPPPLLYLPPTCPSMLVGSPPLYPSPPQNYESPPAVGQVSPTEASVSPAHQELVHFTLNSTDPVEQTQVHRRRTGRDAHHHQLMKDRVSRTAGMYAEGNCSQQQLMTHSKTALLFSAGHPHPQGRDYHSYCSTRQTDKQHFSPNNRESMPYSHLSPSHYDTSILIN